MYLDRTREYLTAYIVRSHVVLRPLWWGKQFCSSASILELKYKKAAVLVPGTRYDIYKLLLSLELRWNIGTKSGD